MNINVERAYFSFIHPLDKYSVLCVLSSTVYSDN